MSRNKIALIVAPGALLLLAACSSSPAKTTPSTTHAAGPAATTNTTQPAGVPTGKATSSCDVVSQSQASAALGGQPVQSPVMGHAYVEGGVACVFNGPSAIGDNPDIPYADTVRVVLVTGQDAKTYFDDYQSKVSAQAISGLGDAAFYDGYASISVLKGSSYVRIAVGVANNLGVEKTLAAEALARM
ncbi:MAG TPA: hypothetical protein VEV45_10695 [Streptosporangiaceae bacterium]|nr:hypothetical protein [Streptosporangiaceae bacterium]